jgi:hypothetical protein
MVLETMRIALNSLPWGAAMVANPSGLEANIRSPKAGYKIAARTLTVSHRDSVAILEQIVGPKT